MQTVDTQVDGSTLTSLDNLVVELLLNLGHNLLDTGRMDTTIAYQLMESQAANLTANGIETADNDSLRCIVNHDFHTTGGFQSTDVTTLTTNHAALHIVVLNMEDRHTILDGCFCGHTLNGLDHNLLGLGIGIELRLVHNLIDIGSSISTGFILHSFHQAVLGFLGTQS